MSCLGADIQNMIYILNKFVNQFIPYTCSIGWAETSLVYARGATIVIKSLYLVQGNTFSKTNID